MQEIAQQFSKELQDLLDMYKTQLSVPHIMSIAEDIFHKTLSIKYHPELHPELHSKAINYFYKAQDINLSH